MSPSNQTQALEVVGDMLVCVLVTSRPKAKRKNPKVGFLTMAKIFAGGVFDGVFAVFGKPDPPSR